MPLVRAGRRVYQDHPTLRSEYTARDIIRHGRGPGIRNDEAYHEALAVFADGWGAV